MICSNSALGSVFPLVLDWIVVLMTYDQTSNWTTDTGCRE